MYLLSISSGVAVFAYNIRRILNSPSMAVWTLKRWYTTVTIFIISAGFLLFGLQANFPDLSIAAHFILAAGFAMMIAAPCSIRGFNDKKILRFFRSLVFLELALITIANLF